MKEKAQINLNTDGIKSKVEFPKKKANSLMCFRGKFAFGLLKRHRKNNFSVSISLICSLYCLNRWETKAARKKGTRWTQVTNATCDKCVTDINTENERLKNWCVYKWHILVQINKLKHISSGFVRFYDTIKFVYWRRNKNRGIWADFNGSAIKKIKEISVKQKKKRTEKLIQRLKRRTLLQLIIRLLIIYIYLCTANCSFFFV